MNIVILRGNLTRDPELRHINSASSDRKTAVVNFTVAVSREFSRANGTKDKVTSFISCEAWDSGAETIASSFNKGDLVLVEGTLRNDSWEKDGVKHSTLKVRVNNFSKITKISKKNAQSNEQQETEEEETVAF
jgi:single-strand DNA-binding protein